MHGNTTASILVARAMKMFTCVKNLKLKSKALVYKYAGVVVLAHVGDDGLIDLSHGSVGSHVHVHLIISTEVHASITTMSSRSSVVGVLIIEGAVFWSRDGTGT
ncbi:hypothetical protein KCU99_g108, partial [Aureobasidium melanogenum]